MEKLSMVKDMDKELFFIITQEFIRVLGK